MDGVKIIGTLENMGFAFSLAIDCESPGRPISETVTLLGFALLLLNCGAARVQVLFKNVMRVQEKL